MTETRSNSQKNLAQEMSRKGNLVSKVVLLIGNDAGMLHSIAVKFAAMGSDIVLASSRLSDDISGAIREGVEALGGRFLLIDNDLVSNQKMEMVVSKVKKEMGGMDILIDMSAHGQKLPGYRANGNNTQPRLWLSKAILQEISS